MSPSIQLESWTAVMREVRWAWKAREYSTNYPLFPAARPFSRTPKPKWMRFSSASRLSCATSTRSVTDPLISPTMANGTRSKLRLPHLEVCRDCLSEAKKDTFQALLPVKSVSEYSSKLSVAFPHHLFVCFDPHS